MTVYEKITELQGKVPPHSNAYYVGDHLKRICQADPRCCQILLEDLQNPDMGLEAADRALFEFGRSHAAGRQAFGFPDSVGEQVLREFYGLPDKAEAVETPAPAPVEKPKTTSMVVDMSDLWG